MITPTTGMVYRFKFLNDYSIHNGVYKLVKLMTYDEYLQDGRMLTTDFFTPAGKTEADISPYLSAIRSGKMMKLVSPNALTTESAKYAPVSMLQEIPDYTVSEYKNIGIVSHLGIMADSESLTYVIDNLKDQFKAALGIDADPKFVSTGSTWLTDDEYQEELAKRDETARKAINYFSENVKLINRIASLKTQIQEYEALIIHQNTKILELENRNP